MNTMMRFGFAALLLAVSALTANGQVLEIGGGGGLSKLQPKELGSNYSLDDGISIVFRLTLNSWTFFGQEVGYGYNRSKLVSQGEEFSIAYHQGSYNLLAYATPEGSRVRPFASGGGHFSNFVPPGQSAVQGQGENKFGVNYGGGLKVRVSDKWLIRVDYRQFLTGKPFGDYFPVSGSLRQNQYTAGVSFIL